MRARPPDADGSCGETSLAMLSRHGGEGPFTLSGKELHPLLPEGCWSLTPGEGTTVRLPRETERPRAPLFFCFLFLFFVLSFCYFLGRSRGIWRFPG